MKVILLVVENREMILTEYARFLFGLAWNRKVESAIFYRGQRKPIWFMRRALIQRALKTDCTHILFVDTDVIPEDDFIDKLSAHNKDIVSGVYYGLNQDPCSRKDGEVFKGEGLCEVDTFAMGLSLLSRKVCEEIIYPEPLPSNKIDADVEFCKLAKEKGYQIYQDFTIRGTHLLLGAF